MMFLALEREVEGADWDAARVVLKDEARRVWELQQSEVFREIWFTAKDHLAVLMLECGSEEEAKQALATLPLVKAGLVEFEVQALVPYDGFARLFT